MNTCGTCQHWGMRGDDAADIRIRKCWAIKKVIYELQPGKMQPGEYPSDGHAYALMGDLCTRKTFGCVLWETRTQT